MFAPTGSWKAAKGHPRAQTLALRPTSRVALRSLLAAMLLSLGLCASGNIATAHASPPSTVTSVKPSTGPATGGTSVTIRGTNFTEATAVTFGPGNAASFTVKSATAITAESPAGTGTVDVRVSTPAGASATGPADHFSYLPVVTAISPVSGPVDGGTTVSVTGTGFSEVTAVEFGSTAATSFTVNSATSITAVSPAASVPEKVQVRVSTPQGTSPTSSKGAFKFTPTVTNVSPNTGPPAGGTTVTLTGSGFAIGTATIVKFGPRRAISVNCTTTTQCTAVAPELSPGREYVNPVDVTATVKGIISQKTPADQFRYHGLYFEHERRRLPIGEGVTLREFLSGHQTNECNTFVSGRIAANGEATDELDIRIEQLANCMPSQWFGELPGSFALLLGDDGSVSIEGGMGVRTGDGCVYEGEKMSGSFEVGGVPFAAFAGGTFPLVAEEEPGAECPPTETVSMFVGAEQVGILETELVG